LLRKIVPTILTCRNFRGNESEREGADLACGADQNESTGALMKMMEVELWFKKFAPISELQQLFRHDPCDFQKPYRVELKGKASM
jgi:uncharacterized protein YeaO (DUF488 family)